MTTLDLSLGLRRIANVIGVELTLKLAEKFGGTTGNYLPISSRTRPDHPWIAIIGAEPFEKLCAVLGGKSHNLPQCPQGIGDKKLRVFALFEQGMRPRDIALQAGCTQRYAEKVTKGLKRPDASAPVLAMAGAK